jgi:DNA-binding NtrC family response regulator
VLERAAILAGGQSFTMEHFALETDSEPIGLVSSAGPIGGLDQTEREMILSALEKTDGNKTKAARLLKITRRRLYSRMKAHGLKV